MANELAVKATVGKSCRAIGRADASHPPDVRLALQTEQAESADHEHDVAVSYMRRSAAMSINHPNPRKTADRPGWHERCYL
ncbi:hypothetical protein [uncultured Sphingomonas sp.]|uniref:hypothetical protein n=1 Tax=uncultured Sphingomonas sp. TaxID=158754 RepID=UPI0035C98C7F